MTYHAILYEVTDDVALIRLNKPDVLNAMTAEMGRELLDAVTRAPFEARAVVIGATGRAFCAGANLSEGGFRADETRRDAGQDLPGVFNPIIAEMRGADIPVVTAVRGAAAGVGCSIALAGDLIVAGEGALFLQAFRHVGLAPDGGSSYLLTRAVGRVRAMEMMLLGEKLPATKALEWGLINRVVPDETLDQTALDLALELAKGPSSLRLIKRAAWQALDSSFETALGDERRWQREAGQTADFVEGVTAFREKRPPGFAGR